MKTIRVWCIVVVFVIGAVVAYGGDITVEGDLTVESNLVVQETITVSSDVSCSGGITANSFVNSNNAVFGIAPFAVGGVNNSAIGHYCVVVGGCDNAVTSSYAGFIGGGHGNKVVGSQAGICAGYENTVNGYYSFIGGGWGNSVTGGYASVIVGGDHNSVSGGYSVVLGGFENSVSGCAASVMGGCLNQARGTCTMVLGGFSSRADSDYSCAAGNHAEALHDGAYVWADSQTNVFQSITNDEFAVNAHGGVRFVTANDEAVTIQDGVITAVSYLGDGSLLTGLPGVTNEVDPVFAASSASVVTFDDITNWNKAYNWGDHATNGYVALETDPQALHYDGSVAMTGDLDMGGNSITNISTNSLVYSDGKSVREVYLDAAGDTMQGALIVQDDVCVYSNLAVLHDLTVSNDMSCAGTVTADIFRNRNNTVDGVINVGCVALGGTDNYVQGLYNTICGGWTNVIGGCSYSVIVGGQYNVIMDSESAIVGGFANEIESQHSFIGGGKSNYVAGYASSVVGGLYGNAAGNYSAVLGGFENSASGALAAVIGGYRCRASGAYSYVAGNHAEALHDGAYVWADSQTNVFQSITNDEFAVNAHGGVRFVTANDATVTIQDGVITATSFIGDGSQLTGLPSVTNEVDPVFAASVVSSVQSDDITHWDLAYSWGDHATNGYIAIEADPHFTTSAAASVTSDHLAMLENLTNEVMSVLQNAAQMGDLSMGVFQ